MFELTPSTWNQLPKVIITDEPESLLPYAKVDDNCRLAFGATLALINISDLRLRAKTIVVDAHRGIITTPISTSRLVRRLVQTLPYGYMQVRDMVVAKLGASRTKLPIITAQCGLVPLGAVTRESTDWVATHGLSQLCRDGDKTRFEYRNGLQLVVPKRYSAMDKQVQRVLKLQAGYRQLQGINDQQDVYRATEARYSAYNNRINERVIFEFFKSFRDDYGLDLSDEDIRFYQCHYFGKLEGEDSLK